MSSYLIICRSLTYAQRAARILENNGITAVVSKAPQGVSNEGCAYGVKISERRLNEALGVLDAVGLGIGRVFSLRSDGSMVEVWL